MTREKEDEGMLETLHLLRSPANAERLLRSIGSADARRLTEHELVEARPDAK
jgi:antitoxin YefM